MSQENVEWVRQLADTLWHRRDPDAAAVREGGAPHD